MKTIALTLASSSFIGLLGLASLAGARAPEPVTLEGRDRPILLARMVVTATPLPASE
ncbi:MAG: hypothetical protein ABW039_14550 [Sphingobium sp.]